MILSAQLSLLAILAGCPTEVDPKARAMPFCTAEPEFQEMRAKLTCRWSAQCWRECGATYDPCRAGECLAIWRENPVDCGVSFYSGCEWGDWYTGSEGCDVWGQK